MSENNEDFNNENRPDIKTRYEILIACLVVLVLCIFAFAAFRITGYIHAAQSTLGSETSQDSTEGTVLIEVEIKETEASSSSDESAAQVSESNPSDETVNVHDNIWVFLTVDQNEEYYKSKEGALKLYAEPVETDERRPALMEGMAFQVLGFSRDGWAAIGYGGQRYFVKSSDIVKADAPENASDRHMDTLDTQQIRFFVPTKGDVEYVITNDTVAFSLPDVQSSGNRVSLKTGERVIVVAKGVNWYKIIYMNADYYVLSYLEPRAEFEKKNPDFKLSDNTGYSPAGTPEAVKKAIAGGAALTATSLGVPAEPETTDEAPAEPGKPADTSKNTNPKTTKSSTTAKKTTTKTTTAKKTTSTKKTTTKKTSTSTAGSAATAQKALLDYVNAARKKAGVPALKWSGGLEKAAKTRAVEISKVSSAKNAKHIRPNGKEWYTVNPKIMYAENLAWGQKSAQAVHNAWMASSGHKANILNKEYKTFGAALYKASNGTYYWIEEFGY